MGKLILQHPYIHNCLFLCFCLWHDLFSFRLHPTAHELNFSLFYFKIIIHLPFSATIFGVYLWSCSESVSHRITIFWSQNHFIVAPRLLNIHIKGYFSHVFRFLRNGMEFFTYFLFLNSDFNFRKLKKETKIFIFFARKLNKAKIIANGNRHSTPF